MRIRSAGLESIRRERGSHHAGAARRRVWQFQVDVYGHDRRSSGDADNGGQARRCRPNTSPV